MSAERKPFLLPGHDYDHDQAACALVVALGIYDPGDRTFGPAKWVFEARNPVGDAVYALLERLADAGVLARTADGFKVADGYDPARFGDHCPPHGGS